MLGEKDTHRFHPRGGQWDDADLAGETSPIMRLAEEFGRATSNIHDAWRQCTSNAKLQEKVQEEIRRSLEQAFSNTIAALPSLPIWEALLDSLRKSQSTFPQTLAEPELAHESSWLLPEANEERAIESILVEPETDAYESNDGHGLDIAAKIDALELPWEGSSATQGTTYDGTVRLRIEAHEDIRSVVEFLSGLWQEPHFRVLRVIGARAHGDVEVWLGLRQPLPLEQALAQMAGVQIKHVSGEDDRTGDEPVVGIRLTSQSAAQHSDLTAYAP